MTDLAARIAEARRTGAELADPVRLSLHDGYAVQDAVVAMLGAPAGWKIGATNEAGQRFLGVDGPIFGRVLAGGVIRSGEAANLPGDRPAEAEPEILFRLGPDGAVAAAHLGIELNRPSRADVFDLGAGFIVADNAAHAGLAIGPELPLPALGSPEALCVTLSRNGDTVAEGSAAAVLGHPANALAALAAARPLSAGDWIATGAITRACPFARGDAVVADFGAFGRVEVRWP